MTGLDNQYPPAKRVRLSYNKKNCRSAAVFTNGMPKDDAEFKVDYYENDDNDKNNDMEEGENKKQIKQPLMFVQSSHLDYISDGHKTASRGVKFVTIEVDKETGTAQVFNTNQSSLKALLKQNFSMSQAAEPIVEELRKNLKKYLESHADERTYYQKQDDLTGMFGSHAKKRSMAQRHRNIVADSSSVMEESAAAVLVNIDQDKLNAINDDLEAKNHLLPYDKEAVELSKVYDLLKLVPEYVGKSLVSVSKHLINPLTNVISVLTEVGESKYVIEHAKNPPRIFVEDAGNHEQYVCILKLFSYLVQAYKLKSSDLRRRGVFSEEPEAFRKWFFSQFCVGEGRNLSFSDGMKNRVLAMSIVLAWSLDQYTSDSVLLREAFGISQKKLSAIVRALGGVCRHSKAGGVSRQVTVLALPLKFPTQSKKRSGRK